MACMAPAVLPAGGSSATRLQAEQGPSGAQQLQKRALPCDVSLLNLETKPWASLTKWGVHRSAHGQMGGECTNFVCVFVFIVAANP